LAVAVIVVAAVLVVVRHGAYGISWDEGVQDAYGESVLRWLLTGGRDQSYLDISNLRNYGPLFDVVIAAVNRVSPLGHFETRHLINGLVGVLGLVGVWRLALLAPSKSRTRIGFLAVAVLALWPSYIGHSFFNPKDIPFAVGFVWSLYCLLRLRRDLPRPSWWLVLGTTVSIGLTLSVRVGGVLLFGYLALIVAAYLARRSWPLGRGVLERLRAAEPLRVLLTAAAIVVGAYALMVATWPWAQLDPLRNPYRASQVIAHIDSPGTSPFGNQLISIHDVPWDYVPRLVALKAPEVVVVALAVGVLVVGYNVLRRRGGRYRVLVLPLVLAATTPWVVSLVQNATLYDEVRHFLFVLPPLAVLAATALDAAWTWLVRQNVWIRTTGCAVFGAYVVLHVGIVCYLHPYEYVYYNVFAGGLPGADGRYETEYWGVSLKELVERFPAHENPTYVVACGDQTSSAYYLPESIRLLQPEEVGAAQFALTHARSNCPPREAGVPAVTVERFGVTLGSLRDLR